MTSPTSPMQTNGVSRRHAAGVSQSPSSPPSPSASTTLSHSSYSGIEIGSLRRRSLPHADFYAHREWAQSTSSFVTTPATTLPALTPKSFIGEGSRTRRYSLSIPLSLPTDAQCQKWRRQLADIETRVDMRMGVLARRGFSHIAKIGNSISMFAGALLGMLTFVVGPHHLILAAGVGGAVFGASMVIGLVVELTLKLLTYRKVGSLLREELRSLCEELNAREDEFGAARSLEEKTLCHQANELWTNVTFNGRTVLRVLAAQLGDVHLGPLKPKRRAKKVQPAPAKQLLGTPKETQNEKMSS